jgi:hypothetical protein
VKGVYAIRNNNNGKMYVGSTKSSLVGRWLTHRRYLRSGRHVNRILQAAWNKHGEDAFEFVVLVTCDDAELCLTLEQKFLDTTPPRLLYNIAKFAHRPPPCPPERRARGERSGMRRYPGLLAGEKNGRSKVSNKDRAAIRLARQAGVPRWQLAARYGLDESSVGRICRGLKLPDVRVWRPEARSNAAGRMKGRKMPESAVAKTAAAHTGMKRSEETKAKLRQAWQRRKAIYGMPRCDQDGRFVRRDEGARR